MQRKLTITCDGQVYERLYRDVGPRKIRGFIESLVRPHIQYPDLEAVYEEMAHDGEREASALEWTEGTGGNAGDKTW